MCSPEAISSERQLQSRDNTLAYYEQQYRKQNIQIKKEDKNADKTRRTARRA